MVAILAQNIAKKNLDFGKRAQKSAMLSGGVAAREVFSSTVKKRTPQNARDVKEEIVLTFVANWLHFIHEHNPSI